MSVCDVRYFLVFFFFQAEDGIRDVAVTGVQTCALAAVLYEMLAGEPPHTGPTAQAIIAKLLTEPPTRLAVVRRDVSSVIDAALARALAKLPAERFSRAADFAPALEGGGGRAGGGG